MTTTAHTPETLKALTGPALNRVVAEIRGWTFVPHATFPDCYSAIIDPSGNHRIAGTRFLPDWSGDIGAAMELAEELEYCFKLDNVGYPGEKWRAQIGWGDDTVSVNAEAATAPRAIAEAYVLSRGAR